MRSAVMVTAPISGLAGETLSVTVAVMPAQEGRAIGDNLVSIEAFDASGTDLPPIAELVATEVVTGRSVQFDYEFQPAGAKGSRQTVVLRAKIRIRRPNRVGPILGSYQVFETASGVNQLWGDWFIIDPANR